MVISEMRYISVSWNEWNEIYLSKWKLVKWDFSRILADNLWKNNTYVRCRLRYAYWSCINARTTFKENSDNDAKYLFIYSDYYNTN